MLIGPERRLGSRPSLVSTVYTIRLIGKINELSHVDVYRCVLIGRKMRQVRRLICWKKSIRFRAAI
jgi:hypothetical protein